MVLCAMLMLCAANNGFAHGTKVHTERGKGDSVGSIEAGSKASAVDLRDTELVDQDGHTMKFASKVLGDKLVALTFIYTSCTTICPVTSAIFTQLQQRLGARMDSEVRLVSVTLDPVVDTPARLKAYSAKHGRKPGWIWLTGEKSKVDHVLDGLGAYAAEFNQHASMVLVGDPISGQWIRLFGFPSPDDIIARLDRFKAKRARVSMASTKD